MAVFHGFCDDSGEFAFDFPQQYRAYMRGQMRGKEVEVEVREKGRKRSDKQNKALHAMLTPWCVEEGHYMDDLKRDLLRAIFGTRDVKNAITGDVQLELDKPHTSQLTVREFCHLMEQACVIAAECGVILQLPDEYKAMKAEAAKQAAREAKKAAIDGRRVA